jgi:hypothetical protein
MATARQKTMLILSGLGVMAVLAFAGLHWRDLAVRYYLLSLERDDSRLVELVEAGPRSPQREAVEKFVRTPKGKAALLKGYLAKAEEAAMSWSKTRFRECIQHIKDSRYKPFAMFWIDSEGYFGNTFFERAPDDNTSYTQPVWPKGLAGEPLAATLRTLQEQMVLVGYERYPLTSDPDITFSVVSVHCGSDCPRHIFKLACFGTHACLLERKGYSFPCVEQ